MSRTGRRMMLAANVIMWSAVVALSVAFGWVAIAAEIAANC